MRGTLEIRIDAGRRMTTRCLSGDTLPQLLDQVLTQLFDVSKDMRKGQGWTKLSIEITRKI